MAAIKQGWADAGNNMVKNQQTGQVVDQNHPIYAGSPAGAASDIANVQAGPSMAPPPAATPAPATAAAPTAAPAPAPANGLPAGATDLGNNLVRLANGQTVPRDHPLFQQAMASQAAAPAAAAPGAPSDAPAAPGAAAAPTVAGTFQQALIDAMSPKGPMDTSNPAISGAVNANHLAEQRGMESNRNLIAERAAAHGTSNSGGFDTALNGLNEDRAMREGQFAGNAVQHLSDQQNADKMAALGIGGQVTEGQKTRDLQAIMQDKSLSEQDKIAQLDAAVRREGQSSQAALGNSDIELRKMLGLLGLQQGGQQFQQGLGAQIGMHSAGLNQQALLQILGGL